MNTAAATAITELFPAILRESAGELIVTTHREVELREDSSRGYLGYVWVCACGGEGNRPLPKSSVRRGHGIHVSAAVRRLDKAQDAAIVGMTETQRTAYMDWVYGRSLGLD